ncbi:Protein of unknown function [Gryllus bimaculatus]|nr:Protein of unknown function [Gryllus bimaculatus]
MNPRIVYANSQTSQLRLTRVSYLRAKKKIVRQERCLKAKQVYHAYLETTLGGLRAEAEELQREVKQASEAKATESKTSRPPTRRRVASCVRRSQRATSLPPPALQVAPAPPAPPSTPASPSAPQQQQQPPSTPLSGAASVTASLALVPLPPLPPPPAPGEEPARASDDERRKMLNARLRAATQNIAALNKMVNNLRQQLQASEESLQRCKERLNRVEACNQNRLQLVESYKVKTQDLEQRLETALSKSTSQLQTIDALRNNNSNLKCQLAKVTTQRDDCIQEAITVRKTLEEQLGRKTSELQARAISETEQKIQEAKLHYARCTSEQNRKLKEAAEKLNQFGHSIEFTQWMSYCRQLFCRDVFSQLLAEFLFKVVLAKFEPDFVQGLTDKDLS